MERESVAAGASKVATVTAAFWIMKICATTVGETGGDLMSMTLNVGYAASSVVLLTAFVIVLVLQLGATRFHPWLYWAVILATSTAGTTISDYMDRTLALGYETGAAILVSLLIATLVAWRVALGSVAVDHIRDRRAEAFYWAAILVSNTLGTAAGDFLADSSGLGYGLSNLLIGSGIALTVIAYFFTPISRTVLFWIAFVLTRPFGATMGDLLTKAPDKGGLGLGTVGSTVVLLTVLVVMIIWTYRSSRLPKQSISASSEKP